MYNLASKQRIKGGKKQANVLSARSSSALTPCFSFFFFFSTYSALTKGSFIERDVRGGEQADARVKTHTHTQKKKNAIKQSKKKRTEQEDKQSEKKKGKKEKANKDSRE